MPGAEKPRWRAFALALAVLVLGTLASALGGRGGEGPAERIAPARRPTDLSAREVRAGSAPEAAAARSAARRFARAYLDYERGLPGVAGKRAIARYSTSELGKELLAAPVHLPAGMRPPRQRVAGIAGAAVGLLGGEPALVIGVRVAGGGGSHLLRLSLVERGGRWLVAGVGP